MRAPVAGARAGRDLVGMSTAPTAAEVSAAAGGREIVAVDRRPPGRAAREHGVTFAIGRYDEFAMVLVQVTTDDGLTGYGEALARRGGEMTRPRSNPCSPRPWSADAANIGGLWVTMFERLRRWGHAGGVVVEAISGVDTALWDHRRQGGGATVYRSCTAPAVPRCRSTRPPSTSTPTSDGRAGAGTARARLRGDQAEDRPHRADDGGASGDLRSLAAIRAAVGDEVDLYVDANGAYDAATAIRVGRRSRSSTIGWLEEPVPRRTTSTATAGFTR